MSTPLTEERIRRIVGAVVSKNNASIQNIINQGVSTSQQAKEAEHAASADEAKHAASSASLDDDSAVWDKLKTLFLSKTDDDTAAGIITFLKGLVAKGDSSFENFIASGTAEVDGDANLKGNVTIGKDATVSGKATAATAEVTGKATMGSAEVSGAADLKGGITIGPDGSYSITKEGIAKLAGAVADYLKSSDFSKGTGVGFDGAGYGITKDAAGKYTLEIDYLVARMKMLVAELEVHERSFIGGTVVMSSCGNRMSVIEALDGSGNVIATANSNSPTLTIPDGKVADKFRCYFLASDGDFQIKNEWTVGQLARCKTSNIANPGDYSNYQNREFWRLVVAVSDAPVTIEGKSYHYIDISNSTSNSITLTDKAGTTHVVTLGGVCATMTSLPYAGDNIIGLGHCWDDKRQNVAILSMLEGGWVIYKGISAYDLPKANIVNKFGIDEAIITTDHLILRPYAAPSEMQTVAVVRGPYDDKAHYGHNDLTTLDGQTWIGSGIKIGETITGQKPSATSPYWSLAAAKGIQGIQGPQGEKGDGYSIAFLLNGVPVDVINFDTIKGMEGTDVSLEADFTNNAEPANVNKAVITCYDAEGNVLGSPIEKTESNNIIADGGNLYLSSTCQYITTVAYDADGKMLVSKSIGVVKNGVSVGVEKVTYKVINSVDANAPLNWDAQAEQTAYPTQKPDKGKYMYVMTIVTYTDGSTTNSVSTSYTAKDGNDGTSVTITDRKVEYAGDDSGTTAPTSGWDTKVPSLEQGKYLWTRTTITYSDGTPVVSYSVGRIGKDGSKGGTTHILYASSGNPQSENDVRTTIDASHQYYGTYQDTDINDHVGNYRQVTSWVLIKGAQGIPGNDGHTPVIKIGTNGNWTVDDVDSGVKAQGDAGHTPKVEIIDGYWYIDGTKSIKAQGDAVTVKSVAYKVLNDQAAGATLDWSKATDYTTLPDVKPGKGKYCYIKTIVTYTDGKSTETISSSYTPTDGIGVTTSTVVTYARTSTNAQPSSFPLTSVPTDLALGEYLWSKTVVTYKGVNTETTTSIAVSRVGKDGAVGYSLHMLYSNVEQPGTDVSHISTSMQAGYDYIYVYSDQSTTDDVSKGLRQTFKKIKGDQGIPGNDGHTPKITIGPNGNWLIDGNDSGKKAQGDAGHTPIVTIGTDGYWYIDNVKTSQKAQGEKGDDGKSPQPNLCRYNSLLLNSAKSLSYDLPSNTYTIVNNTPDSSWGSSVHLSPISIPFGQRYTASADVYSPVAATIIIDFNNGPVSGSGWNSNDNDDGGGRSSNRIEIRANTWTTISWSAINSSSKNTNKVDISIYDSIGSSAPADTVWKLRNLKVEFGDTATPWVPNKEDINGTQYRTVEKYAYGDSNTTPPARGWSDSISGGTAGQYLWNQEQAQHKAATDSVWVDDGKPTTHCIGYIAKDGEPGANFTGVLEYYKATEKNEAPAIDSSWQSTPTAAGWSAAKPYLWNYEIVTRDKGANITTAVHLDSVWGTKGDKGDSYSIVFKLNDVRVDVLNFDDVTEMASASFEADFLNQGVAASVPHATMTCYDGEGNTLGSPIDVRESSNIVADGGNLYLSKNCKTIAVQCFDAKEQLIVSASLGVMRNTITYHLTRMADTVAVIKPSDTSTSATFKLHYNLHYTAAKLVGTVSHNATITSITASIEGKDIVTTVNGLEGTRRGDGKTDYTAQNSSSVPNTIPVSVKLSDGTILPDVVPVTIQGGVAIDINNNINQLSSTVADNHQKAMSTITQKAGEISAKVSSIESGKVDTSLRTEADIDMTGTQWDANTFYPVAIRLNKEGEESPNIRFHIRVSHQLRTGYRSGAGYGFHPSGFNMSLAWEVYASGWGTRDPQRVVTDYQKSWVKEGEKLAGSLGQFQPSSTEFVYLRGGAKWHITVFGDTDIVIAAYNTSTTLSETGDGGVVASTTLAPLTADKLVEAQTNLLATGIDIDTHTVKFTGSQFLWQNSNGVKVAYLDDNGNATFSGIINAAGGHFSGDITSTATISGGKLVGAEITSMSEDKKSTTTIKGGQVTTNNLVADGGSIGGFNISQYQIGSDSVKNADDFAKQKEMSLYRDYIYFNSPNRRALLGCLMSLGQQMMESLQIYSYNTVADYGIVASIRNYANLGFGSNAVALHLNGCIEGLAVQTEEASKDCTIGKYTGSFLIVGAGTKYYLPDMEPWDEGHEIKIKRLVASPDGVKPQDDWTVILNAGKYNEYKQTVYLGKDATNPVSASSKDVGYSATDYNKVTWTVVEKDGMKLFHHEWQTCMSVDTGLVQTGIGIHSPGDAMTFIFHGSLTTTKYANCKGCWVQYKHPRDW